MTRVVTLSSLCFLAACGFAAAQVPTLTPLTADELRFIDTKHFAEIDSATLERARTELDRFFTTPAVRDDVARHLSELKLSPQVVARLCAVRTNRLPQTPGVVEIKTRVGATNIAYMLGLPAGYVRTTPTPMIVRMVNISDTPEQIRVYIDKKLAAHPDTLVLVIANDPNERYGPSLIGMNRAVVALRHACDLVNVDPARVTLLGFGPAGRGVWGLGLHYPTYFAALGIMGSKAGAEFERVRMANLLNTGVALWHDQSDEAVPVTEARQIVKILQRLKVPLDYVETKEIGHAPDEATSLKIEDLARARTRVLSPRRVVLQSMRPELALNRADWLRINQPRIIGDPRQSIIPRSRGVLVTLPQVFRAEAESSRDNVIEIKAENVDSLRIYLDDTLCDFKRPLIVRVNKNEVFEGIVTPSIDVVLRDQQLLGRGWREYSAAIDLETIKGVWTATVVSGPTTQPTTQATSSPTTTPTSTRQATTRPTR